MDELSEYKKIIHSTTLKILTFLPENIHDEIIRKINLALDASYFCGVEDYLEDPGVMEMLLNRYRDNGYKADY